jgi:ligand-binding SRPBCC domain-containing protein
MTVRFELETAIAAPIERVFDLSLDVDVHRESMSRSGERVIGGVRQGAMGLGDEVTWRARHFGVPFTMTSRIVELDRPRSFVDAQVSGPFRRFRHEHHFASVDGGTTMWDRVELDAPLSFLGDAVERAVLGRYLRRLIVTRNGHLRQAAERQIG